MDQTPLSVDPDRLRAAARHAEGSAHALNDFRPVHPGGNELPGSAVSVALQSARVTERLDTVARALAHWATRARASAAAFDTAEQENAHRFAEP